MALETDALSANRLLATAASVRREGLVDAARVTHHHRGKRLYATGDPIHELVFPLEGMVSMTLDSKEGTTVEIAIVGAEGAVGLDSYLGISRASTNAVVQVAGAMAHVASAEVVRWAARDDRLQVAMAEFVRSLLIETSQSAVCNQLHSVEQRTARWLLHASDRARTYELKLTHEFVAQMLGVRRASVTTVIGIFARARLITTQRALISIADREGLRSLTCECYAIVHEATPPH